MHWMISIRSSISTTSYRGCIYILCDNTTHRPYVFRVIALLRFRGPSSLHLSVSADHKNLIWSCRDSKGSCPSEGFAGGVFHTSLRPACPDSFDAKSL